MLHEGFNPIRSDLSSEIENILAVQKGLLDHCVIYMPSNRAFERSVEVNPDNAVASMFLLAKSYEGEHADLFPSDILKESLLNDQKLYPSGNRLPFTNLNRKLWPS